MVTNDVSSSAKLKPMLRSGCRRQNGTAGRRFLPAAGQSEKTALRHHEQSGAPGSWRKLSDPKPCHPWISQQTNETTDCNPAVLPASAQYGWSKEFVAAVLERAAPAGRRPPVCEYISLNSGARSTSALSTMIRIGHSG